MITPEEYYQSLLDAHVACATDGDKLGAELYAELIDDLVEFARSQCEDAIKLYLKYYKKEIRSRGGLIPFLNFKIPYDADDYEPGRCDILTDHWWPVAKKDGSKTLKKWLASVKP